MYTSYFTHTLFLQSANNIVSFLQE